MAISTTQTSAALAVSFQGAAAEIWHYYVPAITPGLGGGAVTTLVGICAAMIIAHFMPKDPTPTQGPTQ